MIEFPEHLPMLLEEVKEKLYLKCQAKMKGLERTLLRSERMLAQLRQCSLKFAPEFLTAG